MSQFEINTRTNELQDERLDVCAHSLSPDVSVSHETPLNPPDVPRTGALSLSRPHSLVSLLPSSVSKGKDHSSFDSNLNMNWSAEMHHVDPPSCVSSSPMDWGLNLKAVALKKARRR
eukprot:1626996-Rhodomonas_salina.1